MTDKSCCRHMLHFESKIRQYFSLLKFYMAIIHIILFLFYRYFVKLSLEINIIVKFYVDEEYVESGICRNQEKTYDNKMFLFS